MVGDIIIHSPIRTRDKHIARVFYGLLRRAVGIMKKSETCATKGNGFSLKLPVFLVA